MVASFAAFPNIVWLNGNDFQSWSTPADDAVALAVARGIKATDPTALQTVELDYPLSSSLDDFRWKGLAKIESAYTILRNVQRSPEGLRRRKPAPDRDDRGELRVRELLLQGRRRCGDEEYWTALSGAAGQFYGNKYTWQFLPGWQWHLDTPGSIQVGYLTSLLSKRRWYALVPDTSHLLITAGYGTYGTP